MNDSNVKDNYSRIQIIGGKWKSRKIAFPELDKLRPTGSRVRETLFNWLSPCIVGAKCLDLFAGSGILSFEALSRGAAAATAIDNNPQCYRSLQSNKETLAASELTIIQQDAMLWLTGNASLISKYDIIFIDPPYQQQLLPKIFALIPAASNLIYFEDNAKIDLTLLPETWELLKAKQAGNVYYYLAQNQGNN